MMKVRMKSKYAKCETLEELAGKLREALDLPLDAPPWEDSLTDDPPGVDCDNPRDEIERMLCELMRQG